MNSHRIWTTKSSATDVAVFVCKNCQEFLFVKLWQHFTGQQDCGMEHSDSYGIINSRRFKENEPGLVPVIRLAISSLVGRKCG